MQYATILIEELDALSDSDKFILLSKIGETGLDTIRKSPDGTRGIIKWEGENPLDELGISNVVYTHDGIVQLAGTGEWTKARGS